jgi:8-oxo-dGTP diphosphatase
MKSRELPKVSPCIVVAAAIIQQGEAFLLSRRKQESDMGGLWEFPGGKKEPGETLENCLRREVKEELGVEISEPQPFYFLRYPYLEKEVELHFFTCTIMRGHPQALDCAEIAWVHKDELVFYEFPPADIPILERILQAGPSEGKIS